MNNKNVLIIGSKFYEYVCMDKIIDSFQKNIRCNLSIPGNNNGNKYDMLIVGWTLTKCIAQENGDKMFKDLKNFKLFNVVHTDNFFKAIWSGKYNYIYRTNKILNAKIKLFLNAINSPVNFTKTPRAGFGAITLGFRKSQKPFIVGFSIYDEKYQCFYHKGFSNIHSDNSSCHDDNSLEREILRYLHSVNYIDISLCMIKNMYIPTFEINYKHVIPTSFILSKMVTLYKLIALEFNIDDELKTINNLMGWNIINDKYEQSNILTLKNEKQNNIKCVYIENDMFAKDYGKLYNLFYDDDIKRNQTFKKGTILLYDPSKIKKDITIEIKHTTYNIILEKNIIYNNDKKEIFNNINTPDLIVRPFFKYNKKDINTDKKDINIDKKDKDIDKKDINVDKNKDKKNKRITNNKQKNILNFNINKIIEKLRNINKDKIETLKKMQKNIESFIKQKNTNAKKQTVIQKYKNNTNVKKKVVPKNHMGGIKKK